MKTHRLIISASLVACIVLYIVEQVLAANYFIKTLVKLLLFLGLPYLCRSLTPSLQRKKSSSRSAWKKYSLGLLLGGVAFVFILLVYQFSQPFLDVSQIVAELNKKAVTPANFIYVGLYITLINSFLEEYFFRGFLFLNILPTNPRFAYIYSTALFALYHIGIFQTWFNPIIMLLALLGLLIAGVLFNYLDTKSENFVNSWLLHLAADAAIILIGYQMICP